MKFLRITIQCFDNFIIFPLPDLQLRRAACMPLPAWRVGKPARGAFFSTIKRYPGPVQRAAFARISAGQTAEILEGSQSKYPITTKDPRSATADGCPSSPMPLALLRANKLGPGTSVRIVRGWNPAATDQPAAVEDSPGTAQRVRWCRLSPGRRAFALNTTLREQGSRRF